MKMLFRTALVTSAVAALFAQPAIAQQARPAVAPVASTGTVVPGVGVASIEAILTNSDANRAAGQQRPTTYKAQIDAYNARSQVLQTQMQPMVDKFNRDKAASNPNQAALQQQAAAIQQFQENAQRELNELIKPVAYSEAYVNEQIEDKLEAAIKNAMTKNRITLVLNPQSVVAVNNNAYNLNPAILAELNTLIPSAQLVPPQGWEPRQIREARAQQAQPAAPGAAPAAPAGPPTDGR